ncbi:MAG TPA: glycine zipper 2TM domain-containing protein [Steroidobacteraceae bacterium]|nr:glycine zipper 2TM domain-containing protein [Steroidobacteraceae bacterium]
MFSRTTMVAIAAGLAIGAPALANENDRWQDDPAGMSAAYEYDYARVTHVEPRMRQVRVSVPRRECDEDAGYASGYDPGYRHGAERPAAGGMILGGLIGAVIGHQIGQGRERAVGTVAGAVIGSAIGHDAAMQRRDDGSYGYSSPRAPRGERCETRYSEQIEQRIDGYRVSYRYNERNYQTVLPYDPGERLRVRVTVRPEGY